MESYNEINVVTRFFPFLPLIKMSHSPDTFSPLLFPVAPKHSGNDLRLRDTSHMIGEWSAVSSAVNRLRIERIKIGFHS